MPNTDLLRVNTPMADLAAAELAAKGVPLSEICARFDPMISPQTARAAIQRGQHALDRARPLPVPKPGPAPARTPAAPVVKSKATVPLDADELLAWAEREGPARARTVATRVRAHLAELGDLHDKHAAAEQARRAIATLEKQLSDAKAALRRITSGASTPTTASPAPTGALATQAAEKAQRDRIREWARANGHEVAERGFIKAEIVSAYRAAHAA